MPGPAEVSWAELDLDYQAFVGRALLASPDHQLRGTRLPLPGAIPSLAQGYGPSGAPPFGGYAAVRGPTGALRLAPPLGEPRMRGTIGLPVLRGTPRGDAAAYAPGDALPGLVGPAPSSACPHAAAAGRPLSHRLLPPCPRRPTPLLPYAMRPPWVPPTSVPLAAPQHSHPPGVGSGTQGALCLEHGASLCARCRSMDWGISRCCQTGHEGHTDTSAGPRCPRAPPPVAPRRQVLVPEDRRAGAAALSSWLGRARPASQALPNSGPPASRRSTAPLQRWAAALPLHWGLTTQGP